MFKVSSAERSALHPEVTAAVEESTVVDIPGVVGERPIASMPFAKNQNLLEVKPLQSVEHVTGVYTGQSFSHFLNECRKDYAGSFAVGRLNRAGHQFVLDLLSSGHSGSVSHSQIYYNITVFMSVDAFIRVRVGPSIFNREIGQAIQKLLGLLFRDAPLPNRKSGHVEDFVQPQGRNNRVVGRARNAVQQRFK